MSNTNKMLQITETTQDLFFDLNDQNAETVSGGYEVFTIRNNSSYDAWYDIDGTVWRHQPGEVWIWTAYSGGTIKFDQDGRTGIIDHKKYDLANGEVYEFQNNASTPGNPYDIELYRVA